jgi:hypothetical protein
VLSSLVELPIADPSHERLPLVGGKEKHWAAAVFGVADCDVAFNEGHLHASIGPRELLVLQSQFVGIGCPLSGPGGG